MRRTRPLRSSSGRPDLLPLPQPERSCTMALSRHRCHVRSGAAMTPQPARSGTAAVASSSGSGRIGTPWAARVSDVVESLDTDLDAGLTAAEATRRLTVDGPNELEQQPPRRRGDDCSTSSLIRSSCCCSRRSPSPWPPGGTTAPTRPRSRRSSSRPSCSPMPRSASGRNARPNGQSTRSVPSPAARFGYCEVVESRRSPAPRSSSATWSCSRRVTWWAPTAESPSTASLQVAEAALTGESAPVQKSPEPVPAEHPLGERQDMAFNGTAVVRGRGRGVVTATAMETEIGRIAVAARRRRRQSDTAAATDLVAQPGARRDRDRAGGRGDRCRPGCIAHRRRRRRDRRLLVGVSLAVAAVPEGLPAILSVVLALGVQRMATERAIVKRLSSVETLGSASVICTDKTGTLTRNEMTIVAVVTPSVTVDVTGIGYEPIGQVRVGAEPLVDEHLRREVELVLEGGSLANDAIASSQGCRLGGAGRSHRGGVSRGRTQTRPHR